MNTGKKGEKKVCYYFSRICCCPGGGFFYSAITSRRLYLFKLKNVLIEVVLEPLVGKVDAELFKTVVFIVFKPKDIKNTDGQDL